MTIQRLFHPIFALQNYLNVWKERKKRENKIN